MFSYGAIVEQMTKIWIFFVSIFTIGGTWFFLFKKICFSKKYFHDTSNTVLAILWKILHQVFGILPVKLRKQRLIEIHFFWKVNMLILIITLWTRRIRLLKPLQIFHTGFWNFVGQNRKKNDWNIFPFKVKNFSYDVPLDKYNSV